MKVQNNPLVYQCINCNVQYAEHSEYMTHYRSEHHRYNIKRRLINLPPVPLNDYILQQQDDKTSKQSSQADYYCQICCKKFLSPGTFKQHMNSRKHKVNRQRIKEPQKTILSQSSSSSDFQILGGQKVQFCFFCHQNMAHKHLKTQHNFPPFHQQCIDIQGLTNYVKTKIAQYQCVFCGAKFNSEESVRQHMLDVGHAKLNIDNFQQYEKYYLWKIQESSSESQMDIETGLQSINSFQSSMYENFDHPTLEDLQRKRLQRIKLTPTGAVINGKQIGYRCYKDYYKQYLGRKLENDKYKYQPAIQDGSGWTQMKKVERPPKINKMITHR